VRKIGRATGDADRGEPEVIKFMLEDPVGGHVDSIIGHQAFRIPCRDDGEMIRQRNRRVFEQEDGGVEFGWKRRHG
jgi:hypothetical protein